MRTHISALIAVAIVAMTSTSALTYQDQQTRPVDEIRQQARDLMQHAETPLGREFLVAAEDLPEINQSRTVYWNRATSDVLTAEQAAEKSPEQLEGYREIEINEWRYYNTFYGTPVAYLRALDAAGAHGMDSFEGKRILDFGFGGIGHLRMMASCGAHCAGLEVFELLKSIYHQPEDTGSISRRDKDGRPLAPGHIALHFGRFPGEADIVQAVGDGYDLLLSKNTLKYGYIHPEREARPGTTIELGVDDRTFLEHCHRVLKPGGLMVVYNIYPKQNPPEEPYLPWATGRFPFDRQLTENTGFEVLVWNRDDTEVMAKIARALGWDSDMSVDETFAMVTVLRRPVEP